MSAEFNNDVPITEVAKIWDNNDLIDFIDQEISTRESLQHIRTKDLLSELRSDVFKAPQAILSRSTLRKDFDNEINFTDIDQNEFINKLDDFLELNPHNRDIQFQEDLYDFLFEMVREEQLETIYTEKSSEEVMDIMATSEFLEWAWDIKVTEVSKWEGSPIIMIPQIHQGLDGSIPHITQISQREIFKVLESLYNFNITNQIWRENISATSFDLYQETDIGNVKMFRDVVKAHESYLRIVEDSKNGDAHIFWEELIKELEQAISANNSLFKEMEQSEFKKFSSFEILSLQHGDINISVFDIEPKEEVFAQLSSEDAANVNKVMTDKYVSHHINKIYTIFQDMREDSSWWYRIRNVASNLFGFNEWKDNLKNSIEYKIEKYTKILLWLQEECKNIPKLYDFLEDKISRLDNKKFSHSDLSDMAIDFLVFEHEFVWNFHTKYDRYSVSMLKYHEARQRVSLDNLSKMTRHFNAPIAMIFGAAHFNRDDDRLNWLKSFEEMCQEKKLACIRIDTKSQQDKFKYKK